MSFNVTVFDCCPVSSPITACNLIVSLFQALGSWEQAKKSEREKQGSGTQDREVWVSALFRVKIKQIVLEYSCYPWFFGNMIMIKCINLHIEC